MSTREASCYCGRIRFGIELPVKFVAHCHCKNCRRAHGAGVVTWCGFRKEQFRILEGGEFMGRFATETAATRSFCKNCGTPMFYESPRWPEDVHIAYALVDELIDQDPQCHVYADRSPDWCTISDALPCYGGEGGNEPVAGTRDAE